MQKLCDEHFPEEADNLTTLPGVSLISAMIIVAETGGNMSAFARLSFSLPGARHEQKAVILGTSFKNWPCEYREKWNTRSNITKEKLNGQKK